MACNPLGGLENAISGSYGIYYLSPIELGVGFQAGYVNYIGAVKADTLRITTGVNATPIYSDFLGPDTPIDYTLTPKHDRLSFTMIEINRLAAKKLLYPYSTTSNTTAQLPGISGEKPAPGRLQSSYEGRLRLVPLNGNLSYWDNDLTLESAGQPPSGLSIRDYFHVTLDPESDVEENYKANLDEMPITLLARICQDTTTLQWRTHRFVNSLTASLA